MEPETPDLRTRGARIAGAVARVGWPIIVTVVLLAYVLVTIVREAKIWGAW